MAYENCCCNKLDSITQDELRTLKQTSYQKCTKQKEEWLKQCQQYYALIDKTCEDWGCFVGYVFLGFGLLLLFV